MIDADQGWDVQEAIEYVASLNGMSFPTLLVAS